MNGQPLPKRGAGRRPWLWQVVALVIVLAGFAVASAPLASAHAILDSSTPADQALLAQSPKEVTLRFSENVSVTPASLRVFDSGGSRVDGGNAGHGAKGTIVTVGLNANLPAGSYVVAWKVVSADAHPIHGGFVFSVGSTSSTQNVSSLLKGPNETSLLALGDALRALTYFWAFFAVGGAVFSTFIGDAYDRHRRLRVGVLCAAVAAVLLNGLQLFQQAALVTGLGLGSLFNDGVFTQVLGEGMLWTQLGVVVAVVAAVVACRGPITRASRATAIVATLALVGAFVVTGHSRTTDPVWLVSIVDAIHVASGALWAGGLILALLSLVHRRTDPDGDPVGAAALIVRFSHLATVAIIAVIISGVAMAFKNIGSMNGLFTTAYGRLVLVKVAALGLAGLAAAYNHFRLVPAVRARPDRPTAWRYLQRAMGVEVFAVLVIFGATGALVNSVPARTVAVQHKVFSDSAPIGKGTVNIVIDPATTGTSAVHIYLLDADGRADDHQESVSLKLSLPSHDIGPLDVRLTKAGPGHYQAGGRLFTLPGKWQVTVTARVDEFTEDSASLTVSVRG